MLEEDMESIAGAVRVKLLSGGRQTLAAVLQLDPHGVVCRPVARAVHPEPDYEDPLINTELKDLMSGLSRNVETT